LYDLDFGAKIIDTPGIRGFGIVDFNKSDIKNYFPEFYKLVNQCKFNDCMHVNEPKCIVKQSVDEGTIANSRYENYLQILEDDKSSYRVDNFDV
jgi:ribosome biogenesis GTPase